MGWIVLLCVVLFALGAWMAVSPQTVFWKLTAWQYRNPEAQEPSDISYAFHRVSGVCLCVIAVIGIGAVVGLDDDEGGASGSDDSPTTTTEDISRDPIVTAEALAVRFDTRVRRIAGDRTRLTRADVEAAATELGVEVTYPEGFRTRLVAVDDPDAPGTLGLASCVQFPADLTEASETGYSIGGCDVIL